MTWCKKCQSLDCSCHGLDRFRMWPDSSKVVGFNEPSKVTLGCSMCGGRGSVYSITSGNPAGWVSYCQRCGGTGRS